MASWMVHLRIADILLDKLPGLSAEEFVVGNIAPDSGVPNADWSAFCPSTKISHFKGNGKDADPEAYMRKYFTEAQRKIYSPRQYSFYLGYLTHLLTDAAWVRDVFHPTRERFSSRFDADPGFIWTVKEDWYDLDHKYLRDHPGFKAFQIYRDAEGFSNDFMEEFPKDAFDNRRKYITDFYLAEHQTLDRKYPYLTEAEMDTFVSRCAEEIAAHLRCI